MIANRNSQPMLRHGISWWKFQLPARSIILNQIWVSFSQILKNVGSEENFSQCTILRFSVEKHSIVSRSHHPCTDQATDAIHTMKTLPPLEWCPYVCVGVWISIFLLTWNERRKNKWVAICEPYPRYYTEWQYSLSGANRMEMCFESIHLVRC